MKFDIDITKTFKEGSFKIDAFDKFNAMVGRWFYILKYKIKANKEKCYALNAELLNILLKYLFFSHTPGWAPWVTVTLRMENTMLLCAHEFISIRNSKCDIFHAWN